MTNVIMACCATRYLDIESFSRTWGRQLLFGGVKGIIVGCTVSQVNLPLIDDDFINADDVQVVFQMLWDCKKLFF